MLSPRRKDDSTDGIDFTFMTVRCWNEIPRGTWTLIVSDTGKGQDVSTFYGWSLTLLGTEKSSKLMSLLDLVNNNNNDKNDNDNNNNNSDNNDNNNSNNNNDNNNNNNNSIIMIIIMIIIIV